MRPPMNAISVTRNATVLVTIDIAKTWPEVLIAIAAKKRRRRLAVPNEHANCNLLIDTLRDRECQVRVAYQASGIYHRALA